MSCMVYEPSFPGGDIELEGSKCFLWIWYDQIVKINKYIYKHGDISVEVNSRIQTCKVEGKQLQYELSSLTRSLFDRTPARTTYFLYKPLIPSKIVSGNFFINYLISLQFKEFTVLSLHTYIFIVDTETGQILRILWLQQERICQEQRNLSNFKVCHIFFFFYIPLKYHVTSVKTLRDY